MVIAPGSVLNAAEAMAFDTNGNVWVADVGKSHLIEFSAAQLASSAAPTPADTIGLGSGAVTGLAFNASGNLWEVSSNGVAPEYTPAQLIASGSPTATVTVTLPSQQRPIRDGV